MESENRTPAGRDLAFYAELKPNELHQPFIDHIFVLRDFGRLISVGENLFSSSLSEIALVNRRPTNEDDAGFSARSWIPIHLPPRYGRRPRQRAFHGWIVGFRFAPSHLRLDNSELVQLSTLFNIAPDGDGPLDDIIRAFDEWIEHLRPRLTIASGRGGCMTEIGAALSRRRSAPRSGGGPSVALLAYDVGVVRRTLQRRFRSQFGLGPKRFLALQRFTSALREIALGGGTLAQIASQAGYSDQAHLTMDLVRHTGLSPNKFRAKSKKQIVQHTVPFFKDRDMQNRVRLLVCDLRPDGDKANHDVQPERYKL